MSIAHAETQTGSQAAGGTSTVSASLGAGGSDSLYVAFVATRSNVNVTGVTGLGLTWTSYGEQCGARAQQRIELWYAYGAGSAGTVTAAHAACNASVIAVLRYTGVDSGTPVDEKAGWNTLGVGGACSGGTDNSDCKGTLTTSHDDTWIIAGFDTRNRTMAPTGGDWTTRVNDVAAGSGGDITTLSVEDRVAATSALYDIGSIANLGGTADWCFVCVEAHEAAGSAATPPEGSLRMMGCGI